MLTLRKNQKPTPAVQQLILASVAEYNNMLRDAEHDAQQAKVHAESDKTTIRQLGKIRPDRLIGAEAESLARAQKTVEVNIERAKTAKVWLAKLEALSSAGVRNAILTLARTNGVDETFETNKLVRQLACKNHELSQVLDSV